MNQYHEHQPTTTNNNAQEAIKKILCNVEILATDVDMMTCPKSCFVFTMRHTRRHTSLFMKSPTGEIQKANSLQQNHHQQQGIIHQVKKTFKQCKQFYQELREMTDCTEDNACGCIQGSCPMWSLYQDLKYFIFPKRKIAFSQTSIEDGMRKRIPLINAFLRMVLQRVKNSTDSLSFLQAIGGQETCQVLELICNFFEIDTQIVEKYHATENDDSFCRMNLKGWQSDRSKLYFADRTIYERSTEIPIPL